MSDPDTDPTPGAPGIAVNSEDGGGGGAGGLAPAGMAIRDIVVTVGEDDWDTLVDSAEAAGMSIEAYLSWCVRVLAMQSRPGGQARPLLDRSAPVRHIPEDESESAAWTETFCERLSHHIHRHPEV